ncbi:DUF4199 domain-containing protein [Mangrovimonas sp. YM274]|uniref:DUF4199 domain-containing protein n=1 Tax=Mangrovimonas sp. YM274 TaxID=3070660 RepID=UPI0027DAD44F|nr:DUF4199 domain-containing protein [Mangrovimonas sp. YM274]WMI69141.1 DUF4199 domain-containing protein [Mangrovimonas sp. YM274]
MKTPFSVSVKFGLIIAVGLTAYFLLVRLIGLHENPWLRLFNGIIMAAGIYYAIKNYKAGSGSGFSYIDGFKTGLVSGVIGTLIFTGFMAVYMYHIDPAFTKLLLGEWFGNYGAGPGILVFIILIEGLTSAIVLTLSFMQIFKKSYNMPQNV